MDFWTVKLVFYVLWIGGALWLAISRFKAKDTVGGWCSLFIVLAAVVSMFGIYPTQEL